MKRKQPAKSKTKLAPVARKVKKAAQKEQVGEAAPLSAEVKENEPEAKQQSKPAVQLGSREWVAHSYSTPGPVLFLIAPNDIAKHHGDPADPTKQAYARIEKQIQSDLQWLIQRAVHGEWDAIKILAELGVDAAAALGTLSGLRPDAIKGN
jgi:hypothetical protein